jgi:hypothetical protein
MRCGVEESAAPLGLQDFWLVDPLPPLTQWANYCRASGALEGRASRRKHQRTMGDNRQIRR